jgi:hypothetical protein
MKTERLAAASREHEPAVTLFHLRFQNSKFECDLFALFEIFCVYTRVNLICKQTVTA